MIFSGTRFYHFFDFNMHNLLSTISLGKRRKGALPSFIFPTAMIINTSIFSSVNGP